VAAGAFSRLIPLIAAHHNPNRPAPLSPPSHFSLSVSIFTRTTLPAQVGQMLSNRNYFCQDAS
jgi:hypothetical protein